MALGKDYEVCRVHRWQHQPWSEIKQEVKDANKAVPAWGDSTGVGDAVVEDLQRVGVPMIPVPFSRPMKQKLMERLKGAPQQRRLKIPDGPIIAELEQMEYHYTPTGVRYAAAEGLHDDCVMALALAVYGRDQFGEWPLKIPETSEPTGQDRHPGFDGEGAERRSRDGTPPWQESWQRPDVPHRGWVPSKHLERL